MLAKAPCQSMQMSNDAMLSRASFAPTEGLWCSDGGVEVQVQVVDQPRGAEERRHQDHQVPIFRRRRAQGQRMADFQIVGTCLLYTSPSPRDGLLSRMPSSA